LCIFIAAVSAPAQTPDAAEQARALAAVRDYALHYAERLPDFICTQVTQRTYYPIEDFRRQVRHDAFEEQVTFVGHKESYTVTKVNGNAVTNIGHDQLGGIRSSGEFGTLLAHTFDPKAGGDFRWDRQVTQKGQKIYIFSFRVPQPSGYALVESNRTILVAYKGVLYADPHTGAVLRIEMQCEIPKDSEYKALDLTVDFKPTEVAGREFTLPFHYHLYSRKLAGALGQVPAGRVPIVSETTNEADYKAYRRFDADSSITFGNAR